MVYDYIDDQNYSDDFWFLKQMATHENGAHPQTLNAKLWQFNEYNASRENLHEDWDASSRCPNLSSNRDGGWGLTQLTVPKPRKEALWNWKNNIDDAYELLREKHLKYKYSSILNEYHEMYCKYSNTRDHNS